jgi:NAD+ diphosphatase
MCRYAVEVPDQKRSNRPNMLSTANLDRVHLLRKDDAWISQQMQSETSVVHLVWRGQIAAVGPNHAGITTTKTSKLSGEHYGPVLIGTINGVTHFSLDVSHLERHHVEDALHEDAMIGSLRELAGTLSSDDANILATASALTTWHTKHRFCGVCGSATIARAAGHERHCQSCDTTHFPRTDSAVIMLVTNGTRAILGRQKIWPAGMYSTLAGFLEPGESLEDSVRREVFEEVGVVVNDVQYSSSQPWPFPASLMLGFHATTSQTELNVDTDELETAQWFEKEELLEARQLGRKGFPAFPPSIAISRRLLDDWLDDLI